MIKWRGESLVGVFALAPCFSDDCILCECWGGFRAVYGGTSFFSLSLCCHCFTIVIKQGFISCSVIWRLLHECYNLQIFVSMKVSFFYNVISSKFACGFFRLAILKF